MSNESQSKMFLLPGNFLSYLPVLNETEIRIYLELLCHTEDKGDLPSMRPLGFAKELGVGLKTIIRAIRKLERLGLINQWPSGNNPTFCRLRIKYPDNDKDPVTVSTTRSKPEPVEDLSPDIQVKRVLLIQDIGRVLGDFGNLPLYRALCRIYSEPAIRQALSEVRQTPDSQIKKSKTALFLYLLKKHAKG